MMPHWWSNALVSSINDQGLSRKATFSSVQLQVHFFVFIVSYTCITKDPLWLMLKNNIHGLSFFYFLSIVCKHLFCIKSAESNFFMFLCLRCFIRLLYVYSRTKPYPSSSRYFHRLKSNFALIAIINLEIRPYHCHLVRHLIFAHQQETQSSCCRVIKPRRINTLYTVHYMVKICRHMPLDITPLFACRTVYSRFSPSFAF